MTHPFHDFTAKLRHPRVLPQVLDYVKWRRAVRAGEEKGLAMAQIPEHAPISINLDLTTACNYRCDHCIDWDILNSKVRHEEQIVRDSIARMAERGLQSVILIGGGEPTIYPGFVSIVPFLKELGLQVAIVSNGSRNDRLLKVIEYMDEGDWIRLSLDSASNDLFEKMHRPKNRKVTLDLICDGVPLLKEKNPKVPIAFSFIITWKGALRDDVAIHENLHEIYEAAERAKRSKFDYISYKPFLERTESGSEIMSPEKAENKRQVVARIKEEIARAKDLEDDTFRIVESINLTLLENGNWTDYTNQPKNCHMQALRQVLTPSGLYNCPAHRGVEKAKISPKDGYKDAATITATAQSLAQIIEEFDASEECKEVTCLYNSVNWWVEDLINSDTPLESVPAQTERDDLFL